MLVIMGKESIDSSVSKIESGYHKAVSIKSKIIAGLAPLITNMKQGTLMKVCAWCQLKWSQKAKNFWTTSRVSELLVQEHGIPQNAAERITQSFLMNFRMCPALPDAGLNEWRMLLWAQALGENYASLAGDVYQQWLYLRWHFLSACQEVKEMLTQLRDRFLLAVITNGPSNAQWEKIHHVGIASYFDLILVSGDLPWEKPDQRIFLEACELLNAKPADCLMVGDKLETDVLGGRQASLGATVWVPLSMEHKHINREGDYRPDFTIKSVLELPMLLAKESEPLALLAAKRGPVMNRILSRVHNFDVEDADSNASDGS